MPAPVSPALGNAKSRSNPTEPLDERFLFWRRVPIQFKASSFIALQCSDQVLAELSLCRGHLIY